jgi:hypothetical protein
MSFCPLARQTASGSDQEIRISKTERPSSRNWSGGNARPESAATAKITRFSTAVHNGFRSINVHAGLQPTYEGMRIVGPVAVRRAFLAEFAETAILEFIQYPLSCLTGHPKYSGKKPANETAPHK